MVSPSTLFYCINFHIDAVKQYQKKQLAASKYGHFALY